MNEDMPKPPKKEMAVSAPLPPPVTNTKHNI